MNTSRQLPLGKQKKHHTLVDQEDYKNLSEHNWSFHRSLGYAYRQERKDGKKVMIYLHREVMNLSHGKRDGLFVDHIDGNRLNNQRSNLRVCRGNSLNAQNRGANKNSTSSFRGVSKVGNKYKAAVKHQGKTTHIGYFKDEVEAGRAAQEARSKCMPWARIDPRLA